MSRALGYGQRRTRAARIATTRASPISMFATIDPECAGSYPIATRMIAAQISAPATMALTKFFIDSCLPDKTHLVQIALAEDSTCGADELC